MVEKVSVSNASSFYLYLLDGGDSFILKGYRICMLKGLFT